MQQIEFKNISKYYGHKVALENINLALEKGKITCIMGLSGSGKSTLLRLINRLIDPTEGQVWVNSQNIALFKSKELQLFRQNEVSMVFQHFALLPHLNVLQNIEYGLKVKGMPVQERQQKAQAWLTEVGLQEYANHFPRELSGGQQQRVGIARAFACETPILLMDEPFSALDPINRRALQELLLSLQSKWQKTVVFVTHDVLEAEHLSRHVVLLREGHIEQAGDFEQLYTHPASEYVKTFLQKH